MRKTVLCFLCFAMCAVFISCGSSQKEIQHGVTSMLEVDFLDTGKSDCIVIQSGGSVIMIDCGEPNDGKRIVKFLESNGITAIDYLMITHYDQDHIGGFPNVLKNIDVKNIYFPDYEGNNKEYKSYLKALKKYDGNLAAVKNMEKLNVGDLSFEIYPPQKDFYAAGDNDYSLCIFAQYGENRFLFAGDAEEERLSEYLGYGNIKSTVLKVPHHGRMNGLTEEFVNRVSPQYAVICTDKKTAEDSVINVLENAGAKVYRTNDGNVQMLSDGTEIYTEIN